MANLIRGQGGATRTVNPEDNGGNGVVLRCVVKGGHDRVRPHIVARRAPVAFAGDDPTNAVDQGNLCFRLQAQSAGLHTAIGRHRDRFCLLLTLGLEVV